MKEVDQDRGGPKKHTRKSRVEEFVARQSEGVTLSNFVPSFKHKKRLNRALTEKEMALLVAIENFEVSRKGKDNSQRAAASFNAWSVRHFDELFHRDEFFYTSESDLNFLFYPDIQFYRGLRSLDNGSLFHALRYFSNALLNSRNDAGMRDLIFKEVDALPNLDNTTDIFYVMAALENIPGAAEKVKHLVESITPDDSGRIEINFKEGADFSVRFELIMRTGLSPEDRVFNLKKLEALVAPVALADTSKAKLLRRIKRRSEYSKTDYFRMFIRDFRQEQALHNNSDNYQYVLAIAKSGLAVARSVLAIAHGNASKDGLAQIPRDSSCYADAQYLLGLYLLNHGRKQSIAAVRFLNAATAAELPNESEGRKERRELALGQFFKRVDSLPEDSAQKYTLYIMAAIRGNDRAKEKVSEICSFSGDVPREFEFKDQVRSVSLRYYILRGLYLLGEFTREKYVAELKKLKASLLTGPLAIAYTENDKVSIKTKYLDKINVEIVLHDKSLHSEAAIKKFFDEQQDKDAEDKFFDEQDKQPDRKSIEEFFNTPPSGPKLTQLKERMLGESKLSDYWRGLFKSIKHNKANLLLVIPYAIGFLFYAPYVGLQKMRKPDDAEKLKSIKAELKIIEKERVERKGEKYFGDKDSLKRESLKFFPEEKSQQKAGQERVQQAGVNNSNIRKQ